MSYARFGCDGSDVYVYWSCYGGLDCCACWLHPRPFGRFNFPTAAEMIAHLREHQAAGHHVPEDVFRQLEQEQRDGVVYKGTAEEADA